MIHYLFAMQKEADLFDLPNKHIIGIGATNIPEIRETDIVVNIGFCGGFGYEVGEIIEPTFVLHEKDLMGTTIYNHENDKICVTCDEFVETPKAVQGKAIYDMEASHIARIKCKEKHFIKIVSDNLNEKDCERFDAKKYVNDIMKLLKDKGLV